MKREVKIRDVAFEGYPERGESAVFLFDGCWVSGWPISSTFETDDDGFIPWEANESVGLSGRKFYGVRLWFDANEVREDTK